MSQLKGMYAIQLFLCIINKKAFSRFTEDEYICRDE